LDAIEQLSQMARLHENNYVFLIGHSFGGLILERTVEHTLRTLRLVSERDFYLSTPGNDSYLVNYEIVRSQGTFSGDSDAFDYNLENNPVGGIFFTSARKDSETAAEAGKQSRPAAAAPKTQPLVHRRVSGSAMPPQATTRLA
jgi:hypothetical protein